MEKLMKIALFIVLLVIAGCAKEEIQPEPLNSSDDTTLSSDDSALKGAKAKHGKHKAVPLKGEFEVYVSKQLNTPTDLPPPKKQEVLGEGNLSHLGKTQVYINQKWWPNTPPPAPEQEFHQWTGRGIGNFVFTAANGDELFASYNDAFSDHQTPTYVELSFTGEINGGTGRFSDAIGTFSWTGVFNPATNAGTVTVTGTIKY